MLAERSEVAIGRRHPESPHGHLGASEATVPVEGLSDVRDVPDEWTASPAADHRRHESWRFVGGRKVPSSLCGSHLSSLIYNTEGKRAHAQRELI